jgi:periplasmic divalent cation tolerance protein
MTDKIVVLVTTKGVTEAKKIARALVEEKLAACANVITSVRSIYRWEGKVTEETECLMIIKSTRGRFDEVRATVERLHSYAVPEIIALPIVDGAPNYLSWIADSTAATASDKAE